MMMHEKLDASTAAHANVSEKMFTVASSLSFLSGVASQCHDGRLKMDGLGLSSMLSLIEREAFAAYEMHDTIAREEKEVAHG